MSLRRLLKKGSLQGAANAIPATLATDDLASLRKVARVVTVVVANAQTLAANALAPTYQSDAMPLPMDDPDRWCWPASDAMTGREIETFIKRADLFFWRNLANHEAEGLADKLVNRDRDGDTRRVCMECRHLIDIGSTWRCGNWQAAGVAIRQRDNQMPADLATQLQRCDGFTEWTL